MGFFKNKNELETLGFSVINDIYSNEEVEQITSLIEHSCSESDNFLKSEDLYAIRQFVKEIPEIKNLIFNQKLKKVISDIGDDNFFIIKSIYFDKPETSNWFVSYHQDLTISVDRKEAVEDFRGWTTKNNQFAVQPSLDILENIFTVRIHLDETNKENGALKVIDKSHLKKIYRPENINFETEKETFCDVQKGGIMLMKPLLLHGSNRTKNKKRRRVIHIEFSSKVLPNNLNWSEYSPINN
ncbi:hypothetical protein FEDK69T_22370 [Flavobacterium enshiense DK69]|uniref:Phytanoyl-CoA dioxygenase n=1 Tax=Flavobacterium enshiense DK69 TaxID=1107311 RepID=V6SCY5_9FLAO|nr:phytanoyl-CoA dioxygenase family protein [Flavobacterium enshiense]ESU22255.1 hypothetical protein FEDK69T_22370 [Flavobacterium enshiense DK69]KGO97266.1 phytanoyl-CoA dioxygenase [Flavobacterium enshiense DK69]